MPTTEPLVYFENPVGRLLEHPAGYAVVEYAPGARRLPDFRAFLTHLGHLLTHRGWTRVLGDQRRMSSFTPDERAWLTEHWLAPNGERPEGVRSAVLLPHDAYASLSVEQVLHDAQADALTYRLFDEDQTAAAEAWLRQLPARR